MQATTGQRLGDAFTKAMTMLLTDKAARGGGAASAAVRGATYREVLKDLPERVVVEACMAALRAPSPWAPTAGELRAWCMKSLEPVHGELHLISRVLDAKPLDEPDEEQRALIGEKLVELARSMRMREAERSSGGAAPAAETPEEALERLKASPMPSLSAGALKGFGGGADV
jgi:hypothetical protein